MLSNSATSAANEIDSALPKNAPFQIQNANSAQIEELIQNLNLLLSEMNELESSSLAGVAQLLPDHRASALNFVDYVAFRRHLPAAIWRSSAAIRDSLRCRKKSSGHVRQRICQ